MKRILLLLCTIFYLPAFVPAPNPSQERKLPTFEQMVKQEEARQNKIREDEELHKKVVKEQEERQLQERRLALTKRRENLEKQKTDVEEQRKKVAALEKQNIAKKLERDAQQSQVIAHQESIESLLANLPPDLKRLILATIVPSEVLNIPALAKEITTRAATNKSLHAIINNPQNMLSILKSLPKAGALVLAEGLRNMPGIRSSEVREWLKNIKLVNGHELFRALGSNARPPENSLDEKPNLKTITNLLENPDINVNWKNAQGWTPLMKAVQRKKNKEIVEFFIANGANVNAKNQNGDTAIIEASHFGNTEIVRLLIAAGANVNIQNVYGLTALMNANMGFGYPEVVKLLISAGANVNAQDSSGETALMFACRMGRNQIVKLLLAAGAKVDIKNNDGETALMIASCLQHQNSEIITLLLASGADPLIQSNSGESALDFARHGRRIDWRSYTERDRSGALYYETIKLLEDAEKTQKEKATSK